MQEKSAIAKVPIAAAPTSPLDWRVLLAITVKTQSGSSGSKMEGNDMNKNLNINDIAYAAFANACDKGFHSNPDGTAKDRNLSEALCLIHSEVSEAMEELRVNDDPSHRYYRAEDGKPEGFVVELADVIIRIGDLVGGLNLVDELAQAIKDKMAFNATRPHMHGKEF